MKNYKKGGHMDVIENLYNELPAFTDVFTEDTFYIFVVCFVLSTVLLAFILSRFITLKPFEWLQWCWGFLIFKRCLDD